MKMKNLRELTREELLNRNDQLLSDVFAMRIKHALGQLENPLQLRATRRQIAQVRTILRQQGVVEVVRQRTRGTRAKAPKGAVRAKAAAGESAAAAVATAAPAKPKTKTKKK